MNGMNDQRFHDLAMKVLACQATEAERAELDSLLTGSLELKAEFERLRIDVRIGTELLPVVAATEANAPEFPRLRSRPVANEGPANPGSQHRIGKGSGVCARMGVAIVARSRHSNCSDRHFV